MRYPKIVGLCFASALSVSMALAGNAAAAELLWLVCLRGTNNALTKYENSKCLRATGGGNEWQSLGVPAEAAITVKILNFTLTFKDNGVGSGVRCLDGPGSSGEGVIEAKGRGRVRVAEILPGSVKAQCQGEGLCKKALAVRGVDLPWNIQLTEGPEKKLLTEIANTGAGEPGWAVECETLLGNKTDTCVSENKENEKWELISEKGRNPEGFEELLVRGRYESARKWKCTEGGAKAGEIIGLVAFLLPGGALSTNKE